MIAALTGPVHSGKTTLLGEVARALIEQGRAVSGFLSLSLWHAGRISGYDLKDIRTGRARPYIRLEGQKRWERIGRFTFIPEALAQARAAIRLGGDTVCFVDEIGPLELEGRGLWPELKAGLEGSSRDWMLVVRDAVLPRFQRMVTVDMSVFDIRDPETRERLTGAWTHERNL